MHCLYQDQANRECLAPIKSRTAKTCKTMHMTEVDPSNEPLRRTWHDLTMFFTKVLHEAVRQTFNLNSSSSTRSAPTLTLKCAHDCIVDPLTDETIAPHFVGDCAKLCVHFADVVAKGKFGDSEPGLYVVLAENAKKNVTKTSKNVSIQNILFEIRFFNCKCQCDKT